MRTQQTNARNAQQSKKKKRYAAIAVAGVIGLATAGGAYSYWTSLGDGTGTATTRAGNAKPFSVTGGAANAMFPGDTPQTVTATVKNIGSENYTVQALKAWVSTDKTGCDGTDFLIDGAAAPASAATPVSITLTQTDLAPNATTTASFTMQFNNKATTDQSACKGAAVTIHYLAS
ncbi:hypothetical protein [Terrabacter sp. BE26]|uniref:hypothetical protein n=1 Tax=Terrabacter sp. BE26 TaxID=2898152 RepID=UPI0035BE2306